MRTHTPGPWTAITGRPVKTGEYADYYIVTEAEEVVARSVSKANAHLIAAAPDLLAACKQLVDLTHDYDPRAMLAGDDAIRMRWVEAWRAIREAVRKAEGVS